MIPGAVPTFKEFLSKRKTKVPGTTLVKNIIHWLHQSHGVTRQMRSILIVTYTRT